MKKLDSLSGVIPAHLHEFVTLLRSFKDVVSSCFNAKELLPEYGVHIEDYCRAVEDVHRKHGLSITPKIHICMVHVKEWCDIFGLPLGIRIIKRKVSVLLPFLCHISTFYSNINVFLTKCLIAHVSWSLLGLKIHTYVIFIEPFSKASFLSKNWRQLIMSFTAFTQLVFLSRISNLLTTSPSS